MRIESTHKSSPSTGNIKLEIPQNQSFLPAPSYTLSSLASPTNLGDERGAVGRERLEVLLLSGFCLLLVDGFVVSVEGVPHGRDDLRHLGQSWGRGRK